MSGPHHQDRSSLFSPLHTLPQESELNQSNFWNVPYCFKSTLCYIQSKGKRQDSSSLYRLKKKKKVKLNYLVQDKHTHTHTHLFKPYVNL